MSEKVQLDLAKSAVFQSHRLRGRRGELSMSLEDVSMAAFGKSNAMSLLGQYERGETEPTGTKLFQIAQALDVDMEYFSIKPGDRFVLCSDGLNKHLMDHEIAVPIQKHKLKKATTVLIDMSLNGGGGDNITVILVDVKD